MGPRRLLVPAICATLAALLLGLGPPPFGAVLSTQRAGSPAVGPANHSLVVPAFLPSPGIRAVGPVPASTYLTVDVALEPTDSAALQEYATAVSTPGSPEYGHFLSPSATAARFGSPLAAVGSASSYFLGYGLNVTASPDRLFLSVSGRAGDLATSFHTSFEEYQQGDRSFFSHPTTATLPSIAPWYGVLGLGDAALVKPHAMSLPAPAASSGCGNSSPLAPCDIARAYGFQSALQSGENGTGVRIGIVDPFDISEAPAQLKSDLARFSSQYGLGPTKLSFVFPTGTESSLNGTSPSGWAVEDATDLEWAHATAPGATIVFALTPYTNAGIYGAVDSLVASGSVDVLSLSWGEPDVGVYNSYYLPCSFACNASADGSYALLHPVLEAAAVEGIGAFAAAGDCGASDGTGGLSTDYPSSDPFLTGVGGTVLTVASDGSYSSETGWSGNSPGNSSPGCANQGGSGGGYSPFPRPPWQYGPGVPSSADRGSPDVSLDAATGITLALGGGYGEVFGTSLGTPIWAGLLAIADGARHTSLGFLSPSLYEILRSSAYGNAIHDVTSGNNGYAAGPGWDPVTGVGTPNFAALLPLLGGQLPKFGTLSIRENASVQAGGFPLHVTFHATATGGTGTFPVYDFSFGDGNATLTTRPTSNYTYTTPGTFVADVTVFDSGSNSSLSAPLAIASGGGTVAPIQFATGSWNVAAGSTVQFSVSAPANLSGIEYQVSFGDGTYSLASPGTTVSHRYPSPGGFCTGAVALATGTTIDAGNSTPISLSVGGATRPLCAAARPIHASFGTNGSASADLPGDFSLRWNVTGGLPPLAYAVTANDTYAELCGCALFRQLGAHLLRGWVNDSIGDSTSVAVPVTLYPSLTGSYSASLLTGAAPLSVLFTARISGGHGANVTQWNFGDGTNGTGIAPLHTFATNGTYLVIAHTSDAARGNTSGAFLVVVTPPQTPGLAATIAPSAYGGAGALFRFHAILAGPAPPVTFAWSFSDGSSAYGADVNETFGVDACRGIAGCPLSFSIRAISAVGSTVAGYSGTLSPLLIGRWSALSVADPGIPLSGTTPLLVQPFLSATGMPGTSVRWQWGDGASAVGSSPSHYYLAPGNLTLTETITDAGGDVWVRNHALAITGLTYHPLSISVSPTIASGVEPISTGFVLRFAGGGVPPYAYAWSFGDGNSSGAAQPLHTYTGPGTFRIDVTVRDAIGENSSANTSVLLYAPAPVAIVVNPPSQPVTAGGSFGVRLVATPTCGAHTVPSCGLAPVPTSISFLPPPGSPIGVVMGGVRTLSAANATFVSLVAPSTPGEWSLSVSASGPNYTGSGGAPVDVVTAAENTTGVLILLGGGAGGVAVAIAVGIVQFRRGRSAGRRGALPPAPEPTPPPSGGSPPAGPPSP